MAVSTHDRRSALWLCLLASCSLNAKPKSESGAQRASADAGAWMPASSRTGDKARDQSGAGGGDPDVSEPGSAASATAGARATPAAQGGKTAENSAGSSARSAANSGNDAPGGASAPAAEGGSAASGMAPAPDAGGMTGSAQPDAGGGSAPQTAGGSATGSSGMQPPATGDAGANGPTVPRGVRQALVDAVIGVLMGNGQGEDSAWEAWRRAAGGSDELSPEFVTPMLNALVLSGTCRERIETCVSVCLVVAQNCQPCVADQQCKATLKRVCGDRAASCK